jgi:hypothetical protein
MPTKQPAAPKKEQTIEEFFKARQDTIRRNAKKIEQALRIKNQR